MDDDNLTTGGTEDVEPPSRRSEADPITEQYIIRNADSDDDDASDDDIKYSNPLGDVSLSALEGIADTTDALDQALATPLTAAEVDDRMSELVLQDGARDVVRQEYTMDPSGSTIRSIKAEDLIDDYDSDEDGGLLEVRSMNCKIFVKKLAKSLRAQTKEEREKIRRETDALPCYIVHPQAQFKVLWDFFQGLVLLYIFYEAPIRAAFYETQVHFEGKDRDVIFDGEAISWWRIILDYTGDLFVVLDFLMNFFVAYHTKVKAEGHTNARVKLVTEPSKTAIRYVFGDIPLGQSIAFPRLPFLIDVLACLPFDYVFSAMKEPVVASHWRLFRLLRISTLANLRPVLRNVLSMLGDIWPRIVPVLELLSLVMIIVIFSHIVSCMLYYAGHPGVHMADWGAHPCNHDGTCGWVTTQSWDSTTPIKTKYIASMYYGFSILTTVGFGDIYARGSNERVITIVIMLLGTLVSGLLIGNVTNVVLSQNLGKEAYRQRYEQLIEYLMHHSISPQTQSRVRKFFREMYVGERYYNETKVLAPLPDAMKIEVIESMYDECLDKIPFIPKVSSLTENNILHGRFDGVASSIRLAICRGLVPVTFMTGDVICTQGEEAKCMYSLTKGAMAIMQDGEKVGTFEDGDFFGALSCICESIRETTCVAELFTHCCVLDADVVQQVQSDFPTFEQCVTEWANKQHTYLKEMHVRAQQGCSTPEADSDAGFSVEMYSRGNGNQISDIPVFNLIGSHAWDHTHAKHWEDLAGDKYKKFSEFVESSEKTVATLDPPENAEDLRSFLKDSVTRMDYHLLQQSQALIRLETMQNKHCGLLKRLHYNAHRANRSQE